MPALWALPSFWARELSNTVSSEERKRESNEQKQKRCRKKQGRDAPYAPLSLAVQSLLRRPEGDVPI